MSNLQLALPGLLSGEMSSEWVWHEDVDDMNDVKRFEHTTVMRDEVVRALAPRPGCTYVDATLGGGGHTVAILEAEPKARIIALDRDPSAIAAAEERLAPVADRVMLVHSAFSRVREQLDALGVERVDGIVADLGVSSPQLDDAERGMSFRREGPLDMRMDPDYGETALELIERLSDDELADVIYQYGEERRSRRIARSIKKALAEGELRDDARLAPRDGARGRSGPRRRGRPRHPHLPGAAHRRKPRARGARVAPGLARQSWSRKGGVAAIISFHSLEDRLVKRAFHTEGWAQLTKKPLLASDEESSQNPRARSAKLRAARRVAALGGRTMTRPRGAFLPIWTLAIVATVSAFVVHLALRGRTVQLGYELGRSTAGASAPARGQARARSRGGELQDARAGRDRRAHAARHGASARRSASYRSRRLSRRPPTGGPGLLARSRRRREEPRPRARPVDPHAHGRAVRADGAGARRHRLQRMACPGRGRARMA